MTRVCEEPHCQSRIQVRNKSGKCERHHRKPQETRQCARCNADMNRRSKGENCGVCISVIASQRKCTGCGVRLPSQNKSGLCRVHYAEKIGRKAEPIEKTPPPYRVGQLIQATAKVMALSVDQITGVGRDGYYVTARQIVSFLARKHYSTPHIGRALGGRDHSTILHAVDRASKRVDDLRFTLLVARTHEAALAIKMAEQAAVTAHIERLAA